MPSSDATRPSQVLIDGTPLTFACRAQQPVLEAAYEAGLALPYACRRGICGLCAAELIQGDVTPVDSLPLTNGRCDPNQVLLCRCTPAHGSITIRPAPWDPLTVARRLPPL
jgi:ferredoxin